MIVEAHEDEIVKAWRSHFRKRREHHPISLSYGRSTTSGHPPLAKEFASETGAYDLLILISQPIVDPRGTLHIEVYVSGYGVIEVAKVVALYPLEMFVPDDSTVSANDKTCKLDPHGNVISLLKPRFCDARRTTGQIGTEGKVEGKKAPIEYDLTISKKARPGLHSIQFVPTYFDGQVWKTAPKNADFTIRNFYERHEGLIWWVGGIAAGLTILASVVTLWPVLKQRWPLSLVVAGLGGIAAGGRKAISERKKRSRGK